MGPPVGSAIVSSCEKTLTAGVVLYLVLAAAAVLASPMFFYWDEWSWLKSLSENTSLVWIMQKHLAHLYPLGRLAFLIEVHLFEDDYRAYLTVNAAVHALNTVLLFRLTRRLSRGEFVPLLVSSLYLFTPAQNENVFWGMQIAVLLAVTSLLISLDSVASLVEQGRRRHLVIAVAASFAAPFLFDLLLPAPFLALLFYLGITGGGLRATSGAERRLRCDAFAFAVAQLALVGAYFALGTLSSDHGNHAGAIDNVPLSYTLAQVGVLHAHYVVYGIGALPLHFLGVISDSPPAQWTIDAAMLLLLYSVVRSRDRSALAGGFRIYAAMVAPMLFLLSLKRGYALNTSLFGRYLTVFYVPCALFWARVLTAWIESIESTLARSGRMRSAPRRVRGSLAVLVALLIGNQLLEHVSFFRGTSRRWTLSNAIPRQQAAALTVPRFYALSDDAAASPRLVEPVTSPELTEAQALRIRRVLFGR